MKTVEVEIKKVGGAWVFDKESALASINDAIREEGEFCYVVCHPHAVISPKVGDLVGGQFWTDVNVCARMRHSGLLQWFVVPAKRFSLTSVVP